jgi:hypothetical protein
MIRSWRRAAIASNRRLPGAGAALLLYHRYFFRVQMTARRATYPFWGPALSTGLDRSAAFFPLASSSTPIVGALLRAVPTIIRE